jgi:hypothetical protein
MAVLLPLESLDLQKSAFRHQTGDFFYISDTTGRDLVLQLEFACAEDAVTLICSTLVGEERCRLTAQGVEKMPGRRTKESQVNCM